MVDPSSREGPDPDRRLDALIERSGLVWPATDGELDSWLARQPIDEEELAWLRGVVRRRIEQAAGPVLGGVDPRRPTNLQPDAVDGEPLGTPVEEPGAAVAIKPLHATSPLAEPRRAADVVDALASVGGAASVGITGTDRTDQGQRARPTRPLGLDDLALLNGQLLELVEAGVPLPRGLEAFAAELGGGRLEATLVALRRDVEAGLSLSDALGRRPELPSVYRVLVAAGEASGDLAGCLALLHEQANVDAELGRRVREALVYPAVTLGLALAGAAVMSIMLLPRFAEMFLSLQVPTYTAVVLGSATLAHDHPLFTFGLAAAAFLGARALVRRHLPALLRRVGAPSRLLATLARTLSGMLARGAPLPAAAGALRAALPPEEATSLDQVVRRLEGGARLADALRESPLFPPTFVWLVGAAEERGDLPGTLLDLARRHERAFERDLRLAESAIAPAGLALVGVFVGMNVIAVFLPIFSLQQQLSQ